MAWNQFLTYGIHVKKQRFPAVAYLLQVSPLFVAINVCMNVCMYECIGFN